MTALAQQDEAQRAEILNLLKDHTVHLSPPSDRTHVWKDECIYCFRTPYFPDGLFVCLTNYVGVCEEHIGDYSKKTGSVVFLNLKFTTHDSEGADEPKDKIAKMHITNDGGGYGGGGTRTEREEKHYTISIYPYLDAPMEISTRLLGNDLCDIVSAIIAHLSADVQNKIEQGLSDWTGTPLLETELIHNMVQLDVTKQEPEGGWVCEEPGCGHRSNLWLNLIDGSVLCGRGQAFTPVTGNGHAVSHARDTGFRIVVRLGTIQNGTGEVFLYDFEDESKEGFINDPYLPQQLAHFGLDINSFKKTEDNFVEMEKSITFKHDWNVIQEEGLNLEPKYGPGFTGLINLGSTCYMNSVLQMLLVVPEFVEVYDKRAKQIFFSKNVDDSHDDFNFQLAKVVHSLNSTDAFSKEGSKLNGILPKQFREVAGRSHSEFSTAKQQDVEQYIRHLFEKIDNCLPTEVNPVNAFRFKFVNRFEDIASGQVRYTNHEDCILPVNVIVKDPTANEENRESVSLFECLLQTFADEEIEGYVSPVTKERKNAKNRIRFGSFPDYLLVQLKRFTYDITGDQRKINVDVTDVDTLDLNEWKCSGELEAGEVLLPDDNASSATLRTSLTNSNRNGRDVAKDNESIAQLLAMGFSQKVARKAVRSTANLEEATNWALSCPGEDTIRDDDEDVLSLPSTGGNAVDNFVPDAAAVRQLVDDFQFSEHAATYALRRTGNEVAAAVNWLFENPDGVPPPETCRNSNEEGSSSSTGSGKPKAEMHDGMGTYELQGFISHIGKNPHCGHYVVHLKKNDVWYIYNDEKVCVSQKPPKACGYVYLYKRKSS